MGVLYPPVGADHIQPISGPQTVVPYMPLVRRKEEGRQKVNKHQRQRVKKKAQRKLALRYIAEERGVSLAVASAILSGMPRKVSRKIEKRIEEK